MAGIKPWQAYGIHNRATLWESMRRLSQPYRPPTLSILSCGSGMATVKKQKRQKSSRCRVSATPGGPSNGPCISPAVPSSKEPQSHRTKRPKFQNGPFFGLPNAQPCSAGAIQTAARASRVRALGSWTLI